MHSAGRGPEPHAVRANDAVETDQVKLRLPLHRSQGGVFYHTEVRAGWENQDSNAKALQVPPRNAFIYCYTI